MKILKSGFFILLVIIIDQFTKLLVRVYQIPIHYNYGITFGLFPLSKIPVWSFGIYLSIIILVSVLLFKKFLNNTVLLALILLLGGGLSNILDRVQNKGAVADWIRIWRFPIFNVADIAITSGLLFIIIVIFFERGEKSKDSSRRV